MSAGHRDQHEDLHLATLGRVEPSVHCSAGSMGSGYQHRDAPSEAELADQRRKHRETLRARACLLGVVLVESHTERNTVEYIASWNALTRAFASLAELEDWLLFAEHREHDA